MRTLITGAAGYIGSHTVKFFQQQAHPIIAVDNLQSGFSQSLDVDVFYDVDIRNSQMLNDIFKAHKIDGVIHFASNSLVSESMEQPFEYYHNNVYGLLCLLNVMKNNNVNKIILSSSAAVYGEPASVPITESCATNPLNTYGETKLAMEKMLKWFEQAYNTKYVSLRYFNAAGAYHTGEIGESHVPETHLIPLVLQVALGQRDKINIYGHDYPTDDGTCIRDYVHVMDLASAHYQALLYLNKSSDSNILNLGNGIGYSVKEIIETARKITNQPIPTKIEKRRTGDPAVLVASSEKAKKILNWTPRYNLETIIADAWRWHKKNPSGYRCL